ncbi:MAG: GtrA family protein [Candidatus Pacebacteria bacterium]|nr:GtrA family protein [Candidatus Paceibacterota bacterium]MBP9842440.1 GtrA family protein [Candidatus Paceibacterota bacterium]
METLRTLAFSARHAGRFTIVRVVSRAGDLTISNIMILLYGEHWFYLAIIIASVFNCSVEYLGNKFWTFGDMRTVRRDTQKELILYLLIRGFYGLFGFTALFVLYKILLFPYFISSITVASVLWFLSFKAFQGLFSGIPRGLPRTIRKARLLWKQKRVRSV